MMTRSFSHALNRQFITALLLFTAVLSGLLVAGKSHSEEFVDGTAVSENDEFYQGTVNFAHQDSFKLIVDDHSFILSPVLRFNSSSWSREQVIQRLKEGDLVKMELGGIADDDGSFTRTIRSITVINP